MAIFAELERFQTSFKKQVFEHEQALTFYLN
jgi:hypothetical protein